MYILNTYNCTVMTFGGKLHKKSQQLLGAEMESKIICIYKIKNVNESEMTVCDAVG